MGYLMISDIVHYLKSSITEEICIDIKEMCPLYRISVPIRVIFFEDYYISCRFVCKWSAVKKIEFHYYHL